MYSIEEEEEEEEERDEGEEEGDLYVFERGKWQFANCETASCESSHTRC